MIRDPSERLLSAVWRARVVVKRRRIVINRHVKRPEMDRKQTGRQTDRNSTAYNERMGVEETQMIR